MVENILVESLRIILEKGRKSIAKNTKRGKSVLETTVALLMLFPDKNSHATTR